MPQTFLDSPHAGNKYAYKPERYEERDCGYETPCWVWLLNRNPWGYGHLEHTNAHRALYEEQHGELGSVVLHHKCENPACINPSHMEPLTRREHNQRHARKLTWDDVDFIRASSLRNVELARMFDVPDGHISRIRSGKCWRRD